MIPASVGLPVPGVRPRGQRLGAVPYERGGACGRRAAAGDGHPRPDRDQRRDVRRDGGVGAWRRATPPLDNYDFPVFARARPGARLRRRHRRVVAPDHGGVPAHRADPPRLEHAGAAGVRLGAGAGPGPLAVPRPVPGVRPGRGRGDPAVRAPDVLAAGASTAIYGLLGGLGVVLVATRQDLRGLIQLLVINVFISLLPGLSLLGHLGGLVAGAVTAAILVLARRRPAAADPRGGRAGRGPRRPGGHAPRPGLAARGRARAAPGPPPPGRPPGRGGRAAPGRRRRRVRRRCPAPAVRLRHPQPAGHPHLHAQAGPGQAAAVRSRVRTSHAVGPADSRGRLSRSRAASARASSSGAARRAAGPPDRGGRRPGPGRRRPTARAAVSPPRVTTARPQPASRPAETDRDPTFLVHRGTNRRSDGRAGSTDRLVRRDAKSTSPQRNAQLGKDSHGCSYAGGPDVTCVPSAVFPQVSACGARFVPPHVGGQTWGRSAMSTCGRRRCLCTACGSPRNRPPPGGNDEAPVPMGTRASKPPARPAGQEGPLQRQRIDMTSPATMAPKPIAKFHADSVTMNGILSPAT